MILDSDWNESERIDDEQARRTHAEVICSKGTPNQGFLITGVKAQSITEPPAWGEEFPESKETYDLIWEEGSFYLGGLRFETDSAFDESFLRQSDWLQSDLDLQNMPTRPSVSDLTDADGNSTQRYDLVYLRGWEQSVTAVEDSELRERALGGPDTSARIRRHRRILVIQDGPQDCVQAFEHLQKHLIQGGNGEFDQSGCELLSNARLTVSPSSEEKGGHLCKPKTASGFLGAENQTIRVQLTASDRFIWGYDNASPYYRVQVLPQDGAYVKIKFLTLPRDQVAQPLKGQAVEILPWGALLPNIEKVAELQGHLSTVVTSYDPEDRTLSIATPVPQSWLHWLDDPKNVKYLSDRDSQETQKYFYLRVWTGGSGNAAQPDHGFTPGTQVELSGTGLSVTFSGSGFPGDHWIIAARPNTPDEVVPWELMHKAPPAGPRFFFAPLALIRWSVAGAEPDHFVESQVHDCRKRFRPLCQVGGCCTIMVGDGHASFGDVQSIQQAVGMLPPAGGEICVLPGEYRERVVVEHKKNVMIRGCGLRTRLVEPEQPGGALIEIRDSQDIEIRSLAVFAPTVHGLFMQGEDNLPLERIMLAELEITSRDHSAVMGRGGRFVTIANCSLAMHPQPETFREDATLGREPVVFLTGDDLLVENNSIIARLEENRERAPHGGLHIGGGSNQVEVSNNRITGGNGNGITLGSFRYQTVKESDDFLRLRGVTASPVYGVSIRVDDNGCLRIVPDPQTPTGEDGEPMVPVADEPLSDVRIIGNDIYGMGSSGISVARFFNLETSPDFITVNRLTIEGNRIRSCMALALENISPAFRENAGYGGIALADAEYLVIRNNVIEDNGIDHLDPICGVFILYGEGIDIKGNRILRNGRPADAESSPAPGQRGGIVISMAQPRKEYIAPFRNSPLGKASSDWTGFRQDGVPAVRVHGNIVVSPEGRAVKVVAVGPVAVQANQLTAHGSNSLNRTPIPGPPRETTSDFRISAAAGVPYADRSATTNPLAAFLDALGGSVVSILNLGISNEIYLQLFGFSGLGMVDRFPDPELQNEDVRLFVGGDILFNDNQVVLDALGPAVTLSASSVLLLSLDDISMSGNQCDCDMGFDLVGTNALVLGWSLRVSDNRFQEGVFNSLLSALTIGLMNSTTANQGTHCFWAWGLRRSSVVGANRTLIEAFNPKACAAYEPVDTQDAGFGILSPIN